MVVKKILTRTGRWLQAIGHFSRLGKLATTRSFLLRERGKLLLKLGEKTLELIQQGKVHHSALDRLVEQIDKVNRLIERQDYGGDKGVEFDSTARTTGKRHKKE